MTLTLGSGPFGPHPAGRFNFTREGPAHVLFLEPSAKRVRVMFGGVVVADSRRAQLLHETGLLPVWYIPEGDVRTEALEPTDEHTTCPFKGEASYWTVRAGAKVAENAAWAYARPLATMPALAGHVAFYGDRMDAWYEEDDEVLGHPRDPYHRVDVRSSSRKVRVSVDGQVVGETARPTMVFETGMAPRYYLPRDDVRMDLLVTSATHTYCPYKGQASYWSLSGDGEAGKDVAWAYLEPLEEAIRVEGMLSFGGEHVRTEVDAEILLEPGGGPDLL